MTQSSSLYPTAVTLSASDFRGSAKPLSATDGNNLEDLKRIARDNPEAAVRAAAKQFEAVFLQMVLKSMRATEMKSGLLESSSGDMFQGMYDEQLTKTLSQRGVGLADMLEKQLMRQIKPEQANPTLPIKPLLRPDQSTWNPVSTLEKLNRATQEAQQATQGISRPELTSPKNGVSNTNSTTAAPREFVQRLWQEAKQAEQQVGIPAQFMLGQAALESGWGKREIKFANGDPSHNLFGIKAGPGWRGKVVETVTTEYINGVPKQVTEKFRAYDSYAAAFNDYARLISQNPRYKQALQEVDSAAGYAAQLQKAGYATDPYYATKLTKTIATTLRVIA
ncbi:flagellar assembly peptidoglycan hydrolase FlgJ [Parvibium lacunae]|uniref:Peptidoglycan hydrolase FlgJ n=1 Tax=Parvibium lacunae TaxID=1888893 RepID=A0A368L3Q8_9BURK|nr:flagellar assembly peptidoglycan hydrolase FlgJ [Parvibium lacunae]RCS58194.1 flagellar assembly peptidoglycan hydrolase FlgJ [Parvibium lacunae]